MAGSMNTSADPSTLTGERLDAIVVQHRAGRTIVHDHHTEDMVTLAHHHGRDGETHYDIITRPNTKHRLGLLAIAMLAEIGVSRGTMETVAREMLAQETAA